MTQYDDERAILERMYPDRSKSQERFDAFVKAGISYITRGNEADKMRRDAQSLRTNDIDSWLDYDLAMHDADEFEAQGDPGEVLEEGSGNVGTKTRYNDAGDPMPVVDDQQSAVAQDIEDNRGLLTALGGADEGSVEEAKNISRDQKGRDSELFDEVQNKEWLRNRKPVFDNRAVSQYKVAGRDGRGNEWTTKPAYKSSFRDIYEADRDATPSDGRFQEFVKAGFDWDTGYSRGQYYRGVASEARSGDTPYTRSLDEAGTPRQDAVNYNMKMANHVEDTFGDNARREEGGNLGTYTLHNDADNLLWPSEERRGKAPILDSQQNAVAENVSDGDYGAVYGKDGKLIDRLNPKEEHDRLRRMNHDMNEEYARAGEAKADPMELEEVSEEVVEEDPEERRRLDLMKSRMSKEEWDKFLNSINPKAIEEIKARYGIDLTKETKD